MEENPYSSILRTVRKDREGRTNAPWMLGKVLSAAPLSVSVAGNVITGGALLVNWALRPRGEAVVLTDLSGNLSGSPQVAVSGGSLTAAGQFGGALFPGDLVALIPSADGQQFLALCKVVSA